MWLKKVLMLSLSAVALSFATESFAVDESTSTYITITNNTSEPVTIDPSLTTEDTKFKKGKDWDGEAVTLAPYVTKQVLWFSRNDDVKKDVKYEFNLTASNALYVDQPLKLTFTEHGKTAGSDIATHLVIPGQAKQKILTKDTFESYKGSFWNSDEIIYARSTLPSGHLYNSFHFVIDTPQNNAIETSSNQQLSVLTYNVQLLPLYANVVDDLNQPSERAKSIPSKITGYDVVVMEELFDHDLRENMIESMKKVYPYHTKVVGYDTHRAWTGGVMIFSKWPIVKEDQMVYEAGVNEDALAAKGAVCASINKAGKMYHVVGTHLQAGNEDDEKAARQKQTLELAKFIDKLGIPTEEPVMMAGDFNVNQFGDQIDQLLSALHVSMIDNIGYIYSSDGSINTMKVGKGRSRIDFVFYSDLHAKPKTYYNKVFILRDLGNETMWPQFDLSDHFPLVGYFEFG